VVLRARQRTAKSHRLWDDDADCTLPRGNPRGPQEAEPHIRTLAEACARRAEYEEEDDAAEPSPQQCAAAAREALVGGGLLSRLLKQPMVCADTLSWLWSLVVASHDYTVAIAAAAALSALLGTQPTYV
jgi:hypothetical protein